MLQRHSKYSSRRWYRRQTINSNSHNRHALFLERRNNQQNVFSICPFFEMKNRNLSSWLLYAKLQYIYVFVALIIKKGAYHLLVLKTVSSMFLFPIEQCHETNRILCNGRDSHLPEKLNMSLICIENCWAYILSAPYRFFETMFRYYLTICKTAYHLNIRESLRSSLW